MKNSNFVGWGVLSVMVLGSQAAQAHGFDPVSVQCSNLPVIPACPAAPACPAVPKQVDFQTHSANLSSYPVLYGFKFGRMPNTGEAGYAGGSQSFASFSRKMEKVGSVTVNVYEWRVTNFPQYKTTYEEVIHYVEYPEYPRSPDVGETAFGQLSSAVDAVEGEGSAWDRFRYVNVACKAAAYEIVGSPVTTNKTTYYLMSNHPTAKVAVNGVQMPAANCIISGFENSRYVPTIHGVLKAHTSP
jgi:hypothetical protein